tara:strand:+ start:231 stop:722 length:492 start_codon:yes stop_codon:yes gene_type:complete
MENYDSIDNDQKQILKKQLIENASSLGGKNHFLCLVETIRISGLNPLMSKDASFRSNKSIIKWKKVIYKDKVNLLMKIIQDSEHNQNLIPKKGHAHYKVIKNLVRTVSSIRFEVNPKNNKDGDGFIFNFINIIDENTCRLSFMFEVMFILPVKLIKKIFNAPL